MSYGLNQGSSNRDSEHRMIKQGKRFDYSESMQVHYNQSKNYESSQSEFSHLQVMVRLNNNLSINKIKDMGNCDSEVSQNRIEQVSNNTNCNFGQAKLHRIYIFIIDIY